MFQPSTSRDPLHTSGGDSGSDSGERVEEHAYDDDPNAGEAVYFTDVDEDHTLTPISESTVVEGVDANILKLPREDQRFSFVTFSPDWSLVVTITSERTLSVWAATNEWVLVGSRRLPQDRRTLKCIAFDPYVKEAVLLCFDSGEIFRTNLRRPATSDDPGSSQEQGMFRAKLVHKCEGKAESLFAHFKFSSDSKMMVYYNLDGEFVAVQFQAHSGPKRMTLSSDFVLKQDPVIYVTEQSVLVTGLLRSSKDREPIDETIQTLLWSSVDRMLPRMDKEPVRFVGKGHLSDDGKYVLTSVLSHVQPSTDCQIDVYLAEDLKSKININHPSIVASILYEDAFYHEGKSDQQSRPVASRTLRFESNHPHLECLDQNQFKFLHVNYGDIKPLIAIHQTNSIGNRLLLWDTNSDAFVYEVDLTLDKEARKFSEVQYCWSSDYKWLGVCSIGARMMGLVCARSGVFVWTAYVPQISRKDSGFCTLLFDRSGTRLMISLGKVIYLLEPPCLSKKPQKHPTHDNLLLSQESRRYSVFEILEMAKEWQKQILFNALMAGQGAKIEYRQYFLDAAISLTSKRLAMICKKYEGQCFLSVFDYSKTSSWESLWFAVMLRWNRCFSTTYTFPLVKEIEGDEKSKGVSVFYYDNEETSNEQVVLLSSKDGIEVLDLDSELKQLSDWTRISDVSCFSFTQSRDRRSVISLVDKNVLIIDLSKKRIIKNVEYSFGLSQWWESFFEGVKLFDYSHCDTFSGQEYGKRYKLFWQDRLRGLFDVADDGETILIGWDNERNKTLAITPDKSEEQFRTEWDEAHESLYQCSMLTENGEWLGFIDYKKLIDGDIIVCVVNIERNRQQRIWLGSKEMLAKTSSKPQPIITNFFLQVDEVREKLTILGLEDIGPTNELKQFSVGLVHDATSTQDYQSLLEDMTQPMNLDRYGESIQPYVFNMNVGNISNFQRVWVEEGENKLKQVTKQALDNKVKVSDVYRFYQDKKDDHATLLMHALKKKETAVVQLCLDFIKDGLFTFHSASGMVKDSFFDMLLSYNELILPMLKKNSLTLKVAEVNVPTQLYQSHDILSHVVFTSDTIFNPDEYYVNIANEHFEKTRSKMHVESANNHDEGIKVLSYVYFFYIANACKVGLNGIIRKLLMKDVALATFNTGLVRATVCWKWEKLWKQRCLRELYMYFVFLFLFTSYAICLGVLGDRLVNNKWNGLYVSALLAVVFVLAICFSYDEYKQLRTYIKDGKEVFGTHKWGFKHYFWKLKWNLIDLASYFLVIVLIPIFHGMFIFGSLSKEYVFAIVAIESLLAWFKLWYYAQPFEQFSALVLLIRNVVHDCCPFVVLAFVILVGFSVSLYVLFQCCSLPSHSIGNMEATKIINATGLLYKAIVESFEEKEATKEKEVTKAIEVLEARGETRDELAEIEENEVESFGSPWRSLSTMFYAMLGEFKPEVYYNHQCMPWLTTLVFVVYMALEMIVTLNMLIAIMGDTFDRVKNEEDVQIIIGRASFIDACEASLSARQIEEIEKQIGKFLYVLTPKESTYNSKHKSWKGKINVIEENVKRAIQSNKEEMEKNIEQHFKQIKEVLKEQLKEHRDEDQELLRSIAKKIEALEMKIDRPTSSISHQTP